MKKLVMLLCFIILPAPVLAASTTVCHCFKDRSFDSASPGKSDEYLLATTQNSFLAAVFNIDKKYVVKTKMSGGSGTDLWIAHFLAQKTGINAQKLISDRRTAGSWKSVVSQNKIEFSTLGEEFKTALTAGAADKRLAAVIADQMLVARFNTKPAEIKKLRDSGANTKEVILAAFLSLKSGHSSFNYYDSVAKNKSTWDIHLNSLGITAKEVELEIKKIMILHTKS
jgi:hypothetical protein